MALAAVVLVLFFVASIDAADPAAIKPTVFTGGAAVDSLVNSFVGVGSPAAIGVGGIAANEMKGMNGGVNGLFGTGMPDMFALPGYHHQGTATTPTPPATSTIGTMPVRDSMPAMSVSPTNIAQSAPCGVTVAGELLQVAVNVIVEEGRRPTETCIDPVQKRPGILNPLGTGRLYYAVSAVIYNVWTRYDAVAVPTVKYSGWTRVLSHENTLVSAESEMVVAVYNILNFLLPAQVARLQLRLALERRFGVSGLFEIAPQSVKGTAWLTNGRDAANALIGELRLDGSNQFGCYADTTNYKSLNDPFQNGTEVGVLSTLPEDVLRWAPLRPAGPASNPQFFLTPQAGSTIGFAVNRGGYGATLLPVTASQNNQSLAAQFQEVIDLQSQLPANQNRTRIIADFWELFAGTPFVGGFFEGIAMEVVTRQCFSLGRAAQLYFSVGANSFDSAIATWASKRLFDTARAASYIPTTRMAQVLPNQFRDRYCPLMDEPAFQWKSYLPTPPFPGYVSGHAAICQAMARGLALQLGSDIVPGGNITVVIPPGGSFFEPLCLPGSSCFKTCSVPGFEQFNSANSFIPQTPFPLTWGTFGAMGDECAISRLYGGVHIRDDATQGIGLGNRVASRVARRLQLLLSGTTPTDNPFVEDIAGSLAVQPATPVGNNNNPQQPAPALPVTYPGLAGTYVPMAVNKP